MSGEAASARASPKSATLTSPSAESSTFSGFTSRWTTPARCAAASACATGSHTARACAGVSRPRSRSSARRVRPRTSSITRKAVDPSTPASMTETTAGEAIRAAARASRSKRAAKSGSSASAGCMIFTATSRSSRRSVAVYTVAMPPRAITPVTW